MVTPIQVVVRTWLMAALYLSIAGCGGLNTARSTPPVATSPIATPLPTSTQQLTLAPTASDTPVPSFTPTLEPSSTATAFPTLSSTEQQEEFLELLQMDEECSLPCWWGIVPGQTLWDEAYPNLAKLNARFFYGKTSSYQYVDVTFYVPAEFSYGSTGQFRAYFRLSQGVITTIEVHSLEWLNYKMPQLLDKYGPPDEIWVSTYNDYPGTVLPFVITLYYGERGILAHYGVFLDADQMQGDTIQGCLVVSAELLLWTPQTSLTLKEAGDLFDWDSTGVPYLPLEDATGMTVETFYRQFRGSPDPICIATARSLWP